MKSCNGRRRCWEISSEDTNGKSHSIQKVKTNVQQAVVGLLFGLAIVTAAIRTIVQVRQHHQLRADDFALLLACVALIASSTLLFVMIPSIYWSEAIILDPFSMETLQKFNTPGFGDKITQIQKMQDAYLTMIWICIFSVKLAFILFFRQMVDRLRRMVIYWRVILGYTMVSLAVCVSTSFIICPNMIYPRVRHLKSRDRYSTAVLIFLTISKFNA